MIRSTYTYSILDLTPASFTEIRDKLKAAGYEHTFQPGGEIDMHGLAVRSLPPSKGKPGEQQLPVPVDHPLVGNLVKDDIDSRMREGVNRYGVALQPHNGRDALRDIYEELIDATKYIRQQLYERDGK